LLDKKALNDSLLLYGGGGASIRLRFDDIDLRKFKRRRAPAHRRKNP